MPSTNVSALLELLSGGGIRAASAAGSTVSASPSKKRVIAIWAFHWHFCSIGRAVASSWSVTEVNCCRASCCSSVRDVRSIASEAMVRDWKVDVQDRRVYVVLSRSIHAFCQHYLVAKVFVDVDFDLTSANDGTEAGVEASALSATRETLKCCLRRRYRRQPQHRPTAFRLSIITL